MTDDVFNVDWDDVRRVIDDLENDGYEVAKFGGSSSEAIPEKNYYLVVRDETTVPDTTDTDQESGSR